jgi:hypothetical protein
LNPGPPAPQTETVINWDAFEVWVSKDHRPAVARDIVSYAKRFSHCLLKRDLSEVRDLRETLRPNVVKALSSLAKYLGIHEQFKKLGLTKEELLHLFELGIIYGEDDF